MEFKSVQFMTSKEKELVYKQWKRFIEKLVEDNGENKVDKYGNEMPVLFRHFTDRVYNHLSVHCSFIAHWDRYGFFNTYFGNPEDTIRFIHQFDGDYGYISIEYGMEWVGGDYEDLNKEMCKVVEQYKSKLYDKLKAQVKSNKIDEIRRLKREIVNMEVV